MAKKENWRPIATRSTKREAKKHAQYLRHNRQTKIRVRKRKSDYVIVEGAKRKRRFLKGKPSNYEP